jgi:hypothetical protein
MSSFDPVVLQSLASFQSLRYSAVSEMLSGIEYINLQFLRKRILFSYLSEEKKNRSVMGGFFYGVIGS